MKEHTDLSSQITLVTIINIPSSMLMFNRLYKGLLSIGIFHSQVYFYYQYRYLRKKQHREPFFFLNLKSSGVVDLRFIIKIHVDLEHSNLLMDE